jgi:NTP pyrophosphatase (non-canonical NTP hydrolase)
VDVAALQSRLKTFAEDRNWDQFHSPKNLVMALAGEAGELLELFQWLTEEQSRQIAHNDTDMQRVREELADVLIYVLRLADTLGVDLESAVRDKIALNERKYPIELSSGNSIKYSRR